MPRKIPIVTRVDEVAAPKDDFNVLKCLQSLEMHDSPAEYELRYDVYQRLVSIISNNSVCRPLEIYAMLLETDNEYLFSKCYTKRQMHRKMRLCCVHYAAQLMHYEILEGQLDHGALLESLPVWCGDEDRWNQFAEIVCQHSTNQLREHIIQAWEIPDEAVPSVQESKPVEAPVKAQEEPAVQKSEKQAAIEAKIEHWRTQQAQKRAKNFHKDELAPAEPISSEPKEQSVGDEMREIWREQKRKQREKKAQQQEQQTKPKQKVNAKQQLQPAKRS
ncbi:MAG TPA: hypothetical protein VHP38_05710 [Ruminiclostridium sp.]|nr:hypothetical protein [Ruminiclostridium sp.]